jgi:FkbM family methyltransferase
MLQPTRFAWRRVLSAVRARLPGTAYRLFDEGRFVWRALTRRPHESTFRELRHLALPPAPLCLDVGANRGQSIQSIRLMRPDARIVAFEPGAVAFAALQRRYGGTRDVELRCLALDRAPGELELWMPVYRGKSFDALASLDPEHAERWFAHRMRGFDRNQLRFEHHRVPVARLDDLGLAPDFIKIDVEGRSLDVLLGAMTMLRERHPVLLVEDAADVADALYPLGYRHRDGLFLVAADRRRTISGR